MLIFLGDLNLDYLITIFRSVKNFKKLNKKNGIKNVRYKWNVAIQYTQRAYLSSRIASNRNRECEFTRAPRVIFLCVDRNARLEIAKCKRSRGIRWLVSQKMYRILYNARDTYVYAYSGATFMRSVCCVSTHEISGEKDTRLRKSSQCRPNIASRALSFRSETQRCTAFGSIQQSALKYVIALPIDIFKFQSISILEWEM